MCPCYGECGGEKRQVEMSLALLYASLFETGASRARSESRSSRRAGKRQAWNSNVPRAGRTRARPPNQARTLVDGCRKQLARVFTMGDELSRARSALKQVRGAFDARNRIVHDMWLGDADDPTKMDLGQRLRWSEADEDLIVGFTRLSKDVEYFEQTLLDLGRAHHVVEALGLLVSNRVPPAPTMFFPEPPLWAFVEGEFTMVGFNGANLLDPTLNDLQVSLPSDTP